ncbi:DUF424 family protein [Candidatus Woesearchaeota archaeon]|nr:DUF424 family protein [Candidatus Woesearchaeota archaeon]
MIFVKVHKGLREVVAICDKELIGKVFSEGKYELKVGEFFYKGKEVSEDEVKEIMLNATNLNIVGERSINIAIKLGLVNEKNVLSIGGVRHAQSITC